MTYERVGFLLLILPFIATGIAFGFGIIVMVISGTVELWRDIKKGAK